jgi:hypothetical protein
MAIFTHQIPDFLLVATLYPKCLLPLTPVAMICVPLHLSVDKKVEFKISFNHLAHLAGELMYIATITHPNLACTFYQPCKIQLR